jgi:predicted nucleic acid-binding Zn ribbon protein
MSYDDEDIPHPACLFCDTPFSEEEYRSFCNNECRENYNNRQQRIGFIKRIDTILRRNWDILNELLGANTEMEINNWELILKDYNLCYHTHCRITEQGTIIYYCYDYSFIVTENVCKVCLEEIKKPPK